MAKYTVMYLCGHENTVQLFGPHKDRERKLDWLADQRCWKCERETQRPLGYVFVRFPMIDGKKCAQAVIDIANGFKIKEELKSLHFRFESEAPDACGQVLGLLSMTRPPAVWRRVFDLPEGEDLADALKSVEEEAMGLVRNKLLNTDALSIELGNGGMTALHAIFDPVMPFTPGSLKTTEDA